MKIPASVDIHSYLAFTSWPIKFMHFHPFINSFKHDALNYYPCAWLFGAYYLVGKMITWIPFFFFFLLSHCTARGWILQIKRNQCYHGGMETATGTHPRRKRPNAEIRKPAHSKEQVRAINVSQLETEQWIQRLRGDKEDRTKTRWEELSKAGVSRIGERMRPPPLLASHIHKPPSPSTW